MKRPTSQIEKQQQDGVVVVEDCYAGQEQEQQQQLYDHIDDNEGENTFTRALLNLSCNDRNQLEEEMNGVSCMSIDETPELIKESLYQFDLELDLIENKVAYNKAKEIMMIKENPSTHSYLLSKDNKLRFLRSDLFDPHKSASKYTKYLDLLLEIYGECALQRPIRLKDFNSEELSFFKSGQYQLLPHRDQAGRRIMAIVSNNKDHVPTRVLLKVFLYLWYVCAGGCDTSNNDRNNVETQQKGIVIVDFPSGQDLYDSNENAELDQWATHRLKANDRILKVIPLRIAAIHINLPNPQIFKSLASVYSTTLNVWSARTKLHLGDPIEIRYKLQQYGIPVEILPLTDTGNIKSANFKQWMKLRTHLEHEEITHMIKDNKSTNMGTYDSGVVSTPSPQSHLLYYLANTNNIIECPLSNDVLFRRSKTMNFHSGNVNFQNLIESRIYEHSIDLNTPPVRQTEIEIEVFNEVLKPIKNNGSFGGGDSGRFLTWDIKKQWWLVIHSDNEIQIKIHYAFRDFRKKMLRSQQKVQTGTNLNSVIERQDGQKKIRYNNNVSDNDNKNSSSISGSDISDSGDENDRCNIENSTTCGNFFATDDGDENDGCNIGKNIACGYFFSTDDGSFTYLDDA